MPLESASTINQLNPSWPVHTDNESQGDSHLRLLKSTLQTTFAGITGATTTTQGDLNAITGKAAQLTTLVGFTGSTTDLNAISGQAAKLATLEGFTGSTADLNAVSGQAAKLATLEGFTGSTANLNVLSGTSASASDVNAIAGKSTGIGANTNTQFTALAAMAASNVTQLASAGSAVPSGVICMWFGSSASVPTGWAICNGSSGTPNLDGQIPRGIVSGTPTVAFANVTIGGTGINVTTLYFIMKL